MTVSRRLRYEVLRRDNHACRYCGAAAPDVKLTVDHVVPSALGGADTPDNLVAACADCNGGKSSSNPDESLVADVTADALRWARARKVAIEMVQANEEAMHRNYMDVHEYWCDAFKAVYGEIPPRPRDDALSIRQWIDLGLERWDMYGLIEVTVAAERVPWDARWKYFAGCCWTRLRQIDDVTQRLIESGEVSE